MSIKNNTTSLQSLLDVVNALPEAGAGGDVELPTLTNEGSASDLLSGKQLINQDGNVVTGTMTNNSANLYKFSVDGGRIFADEGYKRRSK